MGRNEMDDVRQILRQCVDEARELHQRERAITLRSVKLVGRLERMNAAARLGVTGQTLAAMIGLAVNVYWKRAAAARVLLFFPRAEEMVEKGETEISHLAAIAGKITEANAELIFARIARKSKREVEAFLSTVTPDGRVLDREEEVEITVRLTVSELKVLERAREVLAARGTVPTTKQIMVKALGELVNRRDPVVKAQRAAKRKASAAALGQSAASEATEVGAALGQSAAPVRRRPSIKAAVKHAVTLRDGGQCTEALADGSRCPERMMLEYDHTRLKCRGAGDSVDDLTLKCRRHNQAAAERELGPGYMVSWETSRRRSEETGVGKG
jgi:hypothetical protein